MNVVEIKGIVPGAGKTTLLTNLFYKSNLKNKIILTPTNKARQVCINKLIELGMEASIANKAVTTLTSFKKNYYKHSTTEQYFDIEACEIRETSKIKYIRKHSEPHYKKIWNIFIDEASMISKEEMDDLLENWKIQNLILDGDSLQFDPIGCNDLLEDSENIISEWVDSGLPYQLPINTQILLNKSMRSRDKKLTDAMNLLKRGKFVYALVTILANRELQDCMNRETDWHIAYTNNKCRKLNQMYTKPKRWIVYNDDKMHGFYTSEILEDDDPRFEALRTTLLYESLQEENKDKVPSFIEWKQKHLLPAYAITCHKMQGSTIESGDVFIHIDDILYGLKNVKGIDDKERARIFQKFLYVAISRAVSINQINIYGFRNIDFIHSIYEKPYKVETIRKGKFESKKIVRDEDQDDVLTSVQKLEELAEPMVDEFIKEDAIQFSADDPKALQLLLDSLTYDEKDATTTGDEKAFWEKYGRAHSVQHKQHKHKYTEDYLKSLDWEALVKETSNAKIRKLWKDLHK